MNFTSVITRTWVRRPLFIIAAGMVAIISLEYWQAGFGWLGVMSFALLLGFLGGWRVALMGVVIASLTIANLHWRQSAQRSGEAWIAEQKPQIIEARLIEDARGKNGRWAATAKIHSSGFPQRKVTWLGSGEPPPAGTELKANGVFRKLEGARNPGLPDRIARNRAEGIIGTFRASEMREESWIGLISEKKAVFKKAFRESIVTGLDEESIAAKVIHAVVLGEKAPDSLGLIRDFRESGTLHVLTVSGLHVAMVGGIIWGFLSILNCPRRWAIPLIVAAMFGYVWLTGNGSAAVRSAWMGSVFLGAFALRRRTDLLNALGAVLLLAMLWNPIIIQLPGVQLSYGVVAAIGLGTGIARRCFRWLAEEEELLPKSELSWWQKKSLRLRQKFANGLAVSLAASVGSSPLTIAHFGIVTPVSVIATVFLVMQVFALLAIALTSALMHPFFPAGSEFLNQSNAIVANACAKTAGAFAKIPGAWSVTNSPSDDTLVIYDLNYGAEAACLSTATRSAVMIDSGGKYSLRGEVGMSLNHLGMIPDSVIFTHADAGHVADPGLMLEMFPIQQVVLGMAKTRRSAAADWETMDENEIHIVRPHIGSFLDLGNGAKAEILLTPHDRAVGTVADDQCMVFMIHWQDWQILWLGDAGRLSEQALIESGTDIHADLIVAGFHTSDYSLTPAFLEAVSPQAIIVPRLPGSRLDSNRIEQQKYWENSASFKVIDRQKTGGLTLTISKQGELLIKGFLDKSETIFKKR